MIICDVCKKPGQQLREFTVRACKLTVDVDLCNEHAVIISDRLAKFLDDNNLLNNRTICEGRPGR